MDVSSHVVQATYDATYFLVFHGLRALTPFLQRDSFLYWPFLVSSLLIALAVWRSGARRATIGQTFGAQLWWHRSARADYVFYLLNALLVPLLFSYLPSAGTANGAEPSMPAGIATRVAFTAFFFIAYDFGRFAAHCLLHDVPWLWEFHKVHHSAEVLTPMTSYRAHPLELALMAWIPFGATALASQAFNLIVPGTVSFYSFMGLHVVLWFFSLIDNLRHSPVWLSYGPRLGRWFISPAHHQLHHSCEPRHLGCNRGFDLAIWDRLYGTLFVPGFAREDFRMGLGDGTEPRYHGPVRMYLQPFRAIARR